VLKPIFSVGEEVQVMPSAPENETIGPGWNDYMTGMLGQVFQILKIDAHFTPGMDPDVHGGKPWYLLKSPNDTEDWWFREVWLEPAEMMSQDDWQDELVMGDV